MNEVVTMQSSVDANALILNPQSMAAVMAVAKLMSESRIAIPEHFRNKPADCAALVMQAMTWGMNPFAVAQKTHMTQGGALGYEAQLINAVVINRAPVTGRPEFEFIGDWSKILGKVEERKSDKGGKYYVATWDKKDEAGLGVICRATIQGEDEPRVVTVMMSQAWPRFSTQWATDPQQQITYLAVRKWARRYTPDVILGVYEVDEASEILVEGERFPDSETPAQKTVTERLREAAMTVIQHPETAGSTAAFTGTLAEATSGAEQFERFKEAIAAAKSESDLEEAAGQYVQHMSPSLRETARMLYRGRLSELRHEEHAKAAAKPETIDRDTGEIAAAEPRKTSPFNPGEATFSMD